MRWFTLAVGAAAGYLLGSAEGRQNLQKMTQNAQTLWNDPKTQEKVGQAKEKAQAVASDAKDKTAEVKAKAEEKKESDVNEDKKDQVTVSNNEDVPAANATGADPDIISDPSTALGDEGPANA